MSVLISPKFLPQQRLDLEDMQVFLESICSDWKFFVKQFWAPGPYVLKGFAVSGVGGASPATVAMTDATLINVDNPDCFSWFTADVGAPNIQVVLQAGARNYLEVEMVNEDGTPLTKAFWDPSAQGGLGAEFNQTVNTVTNLKVNILALTGGFSGSPNRVPIAIVDTDGSNNIKLIIDKRKLFFRLGEPGNPEANYSWGTQTEPELTLNLTGQVGSFTVGETVTIGAQTAIVTTGGAGPNIGVILLSSDAIASGNTVTGLSSGATGTLNTANESFSGADKNVDNIRDLVAALQTEIKRLKGTRFWFEVGYGSVYGVNSFVNSLITQASTGAKVSWDGSAMKITDTSGTPADADVIARIRLFGKNQTLNLTREDGTGGSATIPVSDGEVVYVELPSSGNRTYSATGAGSTNYKKVAFSSFVLNDTNYWIAFRDGANLYFRGVGEIQAGESSGIGDNVPQSLLDILGLVDEATPANYTSNIRGTNGESFVARMSTLTDAVGDEQEDRSGYLRSDDVVTWTGTQLEFTQNIILELVNTKSGTITRHNVLVANSPIALADGESAWVSIDRTQANENVTLNKSGTTPIPAQTQANKDVFVLFRRVDSGGAGYLHIPFHKQVLDPGQTVRLGASGSGSGAGDSLQGDYKRRLVLSPFQYVTPNVFETDKATKVHGSSTGTFDAAKKSFKLATIGQTMVSVQMLDADFLDDEVDATEIELWLSWLDGEVDTAATYEVSRDGGNNWQAVTMSRIGQSGSYRGYHTFSTEGSNQNLEGYAVGNADANLALNATTTQARAQVFTVVDAEVVKQIEVYLNKLGTPSGNYLVKIVRDSSGAPSTDPNDILSESDLKSVSSLSSGDNTVLVDLPQVVLKAGTYWWVVETDAAYKSSFSAGVNELRVRADSSVPTIPDSDSYNGTVWAAVVGSALTYQLKGRELDLRVRVTSGTNDVFISGYGIFYGILNGVTTLDRKLIQKFYFTGNENRTQFTLDWLPDPDLLEVWDPFRGQAYVAADGVFRIKGQVVEFEPDTFDDPGEDIVLIFKQLKGTSFDNSDQNANDIAGLDSRLTDLEGSNKNYAQNAEFRFWQRQVPGTLTSRQDDQYSADRWYVLTSGGAVNVQGARVQDSPTQSPTRWSGQFRQADATARQFGVAQILEADRIWELRGKTVTFSFWARTDGTEVPNIRAALVEWSGTADSVTSDIVSSWAATPTLIASAAYANTPADLALTGSWAQFQITVTLGQTMNNLILFVWTPVAEAQNDDFYVSQVQVVKGNEALPWSGVSISVDQDREECERFYLKSYNLDDAPGTITTVGAISFLTSSSGSAADKIMFNNRMRITPTYTNYSSVTGASGVYRNVTDGSDANVAGTTSETGQTLADAAAGVSKTYRGHFTAESEL